MATLRYDVDVDARRAEARIGAFALSMRQRITQAVRSLPEIEITADSTDAQRELAQVRADLIALGNQRIGVDIDAATAQARLEALNARLQALNDSGDVQIDADTAAAVAALQLLEEQIDDLDGREVSVDVDRGGLARIGQLGSALSAAGSAVGVLTKGMLGLGAAGGAVGVLAGAAAAAQQLAPAALLLPGALLAAGAAFGVAKLATAGFGEALSAADPAAFTEATKDMAPAAVETAKAVRGLTPEFVELKRVVQEQFFAGFASDVEDLGRIYLPLLKQELPGIAKGFNDMGSAIAEALKAPAAQNDIKLILEDTAKTVQNMAPGIGSLTSGFLGLAAVGTSYLPALGTAISDVGAKFKAWVDQGVESGRIKELIDGAIAGFKDLAAIAGNAGSIIASVFSGLSGGAVESPLAKLREVTGAIAEMMRAAGTQEGLRSLGEILRTVGQVIGDVVVAAFRDLGPPLGRFLNEHGPAIQEVFRAIGWFVTEVAIPALAGFIDWLTYYGIPGATQFFLALTEQMSHAGVVVSDVIGGILDVLHGLFSTLALIPGPFQSAFADVAGSVDSARGTVDDFRGTMELVKSKTIELRLESEAEQKADLIRRALDDVTLAEELASAAARDYGVASREAAAANDVLLAANLNTAASAGVKAEADARATGAANAAELGAREQKDELFRLAAQATGPTKDALLALALSTDVTTRASSAAELQARLQKDELLRLAAGASGPVKVAIDAAAQNFGVLGGASASAETRSRLQKDELLRLAQMASGPLRTELTNMANQINTLPDGNFTVTATGILTPLAAVKLLPGIGQFASGGVLPGYTPGRDVHRFVSPTGGVLDLSGGEPVMRPEFGRAVGRGWIDGANRAARTGGVAGVSEFIRGTAPGATAAESMAEEGHAFASGGVYGRGGYPVQRLAMGGVVRTGQQPFERVAGGKYYQTRDEQARRLTAVMQAAIRAEDQRRAQAAAAAANMAGGPGATLTPGGSTFGGVKPHVRAAGHEILRLFGPMPGGIGGVGARANVSDHPTGHALDFMTLSNVGLGDRVSGHFLANFGRLYTKYVIWRQRINSGSGWRAMENRGSPTANHMDHPHVSFRALAKGGVLPAQLADDGALLQSGRAAINLSGRPERVLSPDQTRMYDSARSVRGGTGGVDIGQIIAAATTAARAAVAETMRGVDARQTTIQTTINNPIAEQGSDSVARVHRTQAALGMFS